MNDMTVDTIDLTPTSRIRVEYDQSPENPRGEWHFITMFVNAAGFYSSRWEEVDSNLDADLGDGIAHADDRLYDLGRSKWSRSHGAGENAVIRWARIFHDTTLVYNDGGQYHRGYWFVPREQMLANWPDLVPGTEEYVAKEREIIEQDERVYLAYVGGEVYVVMLERLVTWEPVAPGLDTAFLGTNPTINTWVEVEAMHGIYTGDRGFTEPIVEIARDMNLNEDEDAAAARIIAPTSVTRA